MRFALIFSKVIAILVLITAIGYGVIYAIAPWLASQRMRKFEPRLSLVPVDLPFKAEVPLHNGTIDRYGYRVPFPNEEIAKTYQGDLITEVSFSNGGFLTIHNPSRNSGVLEIAITDKHAERLLGKELFQSKFKLMQAAMWATPEQVKWWRFRNSENERAHYLLLTKFVVVFPSGGSPPTLRPIYSVSAGVFRGFQIGDPNVSPYEAHLDLFDGTDRHFAFDVGGPEGHGQVLTQAEINAMVASIQPISTR